MNPGRTNLLVLSPERFHTLSAETPVVEWKRALLENGLLDLEPDQTAVGQLLRRMQEALRPRRRLSLRPLLMLLATLAMAGLGLFGLALIVKSGAGFFCFGIFLIGPAALRGWLGRGLDSRLRSWFYERDDRSEELYAIVQDLLSRDFLQSMGGTLVENVPTRQWLNERLDALARSAADLDRREQSMYTVQQRIREVNRQLGRPEEDAETEALGRALEELRESRERLRRLQAELSARKVELEERLVARRLAVERQMLSSRVDVLRESGLRMPELPALQEELSGMRAQVEELDRQLQEEQARITAGLEVRGELERR